jgi:hypothetical protein
VLLLLLPACRNNLTNVIWLESPAFVGFSYSNKSEDAIVGECVCWEECGGKGDCWVVVGRGGRRGEGSPCSNGSQKPAVAGCVHTVTQASHLHPSASDQLGTSRAGSNPAHRELFLPCECPLCIEPGCHSSSLKGESSSSSYTAASKVRCCKQQVYPGA